MAPEKNLVFLVESLAPLLREGKARLVFVGDGPGRGEIEKCVADLDLGERVVMAGARPHGDTPRYYAAADLFLMPSVTEVNPLTLGEALAAGTPVVAVDSFSAREIIVPGKTGLIVPRDAQAFLVAVRDLLTQTEQLQAMGMRARDAARARRHTTAVERTAQLYYNLIARRHSAA